MTANISETPTKIGGLLLAAGGSTRIGRPKQLLQFEGQSLLQRAAQTLVKSACDPVVVVLGAEPEQSIAETAGFPVRTCVNTEWSSGMSSSIRAGLRELLVLEPELDAIVITLCDQPLVTADHIDSLINEFRQTGSPIVAAQYSGTTGVPALFAKTLFDDLTHLEGQNGARQLIRTRPDDVRTVNIEEAAFDVDTVDDLTSLENKILT
jgi:molybdenum cofactor cytidylyltransferase